MNKELVGKIKVSAAIKPIKALDRSIPPLIIGLRYYVSFDGNYAFPCELIESEENRIKVSIKAKPQSKKGFLDENGRVSYDWKSEHHLFPDEIGSTPEQAVINQVTL